MWFIKQRKAFTIIAIVMVLGALAAIVRLGVPLGIDFTGGAQTEVAYNTAPVKSELNDKLGQLGLGGFSVRETVDESGRNGYIVRTRDLSDAERQQVNEILTSAGEGGSVTRFTSIGPVIGEELKDKSVWAIGAVTLVIVLYVALTFSGVSYPVGSWVYGTITIVSLLHDVILATATMTLLGYFFGMEADILFVIALLTILGYSVNDTIVVFDRVRENLKRFRTEHKKQVAGPDGLKHEEVTYTLTKPFAEVVGQSVSETLTRSLNTSFTTLLALFALYLFGGSVTQTFALVLIVGVAAGAYSSICIASPLIVLWAEWQEKRQK